MALVRRPAATALGAALFAAGLVGCCGPGSEQAREENQKMDCLTRCGKELERQQTSRPLLARSQVPGVEELPPVRLGAPAPAGTPAPAPPAAVPLVAPAMPPTSGDPT